MKAIGPVSSSAVNDAIGEGTDTTETENESEGSGSGSPSDELA